MSEQEEMPEAVREACIDAALKAWEEAGISGLCAEGRWELAIDAIRSLDLQSVICAIRHSSLDRG